MAPKGWSSVFIADRQLEGSAASHAVHTPALSPLFDDGGPRLAHFTPLLCQGISGLIPLLTSNGKRTAPALRTLRTRSPCSCDVSPSTGYSRANRRQKFLY